MKHDTRTATHFTPNESFWLEAIDRTRLEPPLEGERDADVLCLGGGYTSLVTAYLLKKRNPGLEVAVLEGSYVGFGASGETAEWRFTSRISSALESEGSRGCKFTYDETVRTIDWIEELAREEGFDCELERTGYLEIALYPKHERENEAKERACRETWASSSISSIGDDDALDHQERSVPRGASFPEGRDTPSGKVRLGAEESRAREGRASLRGEPGREASPTTDAATRSRPPAGRIRAETLVVGLNAYLPAARLGIVRDRAVSLFSFILLTEPLSPARWKEIGWSGRQGLPDKRRVHNYVRLTREAHPLRRTRALSLRPRVAERDRAAVRRAEGGAF